MKTKIKFKHIILSALVVSVFCSLYLHGQFIEFNEQEVDAVDIVSSASSHDHLLFPEVEIVKVVIEKIIDIVTISKV